MIKKGTQSISEFVLHIRSIADSLLAISDPISERDQIYVILQGLLEEYNTFIMIEYNKTEPMDIYEVDGLIYVQEAWLDKYRQELPAPSATTNVVQGAGHHHHATIHSGGSGYHPRGKGKPGRGREKSRFNRSTGNLPTCQLCNKYGHSVMECWHRFNENFEPLAPKLQTQWASSHNIDNAQANSKTTTIATTTANACLAHQD